MFHSVRTFSVCSRILPKEIFPVRNYLIISEEGVGVEISFVCNVDSD